MNKLYLMVVLFCSRRVFAQVGINTITPLNTLDINGNVSVKTIGLPVLLYGGPAGSATPISDGVYLSLTPTVGSAEF